MTNITMGHPKIGVPETTCAPLNYFSSVPLCGTQLRTNMVYKTERLIHSLTPV